MRIEYKILITSGLLLGLLLVSKKAGIPGGGLNNPGNIRNSGGKFLGETSGPGDAFKSFKDLSHGIRAMYVVLRAYRSKYNLATIRGFISGILTRYAPPSENDTEAYIRYVASQVGISDNETIPASKYPEMVSAMSRMEGRIPVTLAQAQAVYNKFFT